MKNYSETNNVQKSQCFSSNLVLQIIQTSKKLWLVMKRKIDQ